MKKEAYIIIIISAILWGTLGIFSKKMTSLGFNAIQIVSIRALGGALVLAIFLTCTNKQLLKIKISDFFYFIGTGILSFAFFNICYFEAINKTSLSIAAILYILHQVL